jgi:radical SAM superfamily enzyme YgiQ (UPF0313 family)
LTSEDLASLPTPAYDTIEDQAYVGLSTESSRGCCFNCSFCSTPYRKLWRGIPAELAADRIEIVMESTDRTREGCIHLADDEFTVDPERVVEIARILRRRGLRPQLSYDSRATDLLHDGVIEAMAELTHGVLVGAECGYDDGLRRIGKGITCRTLERAAANLDRFGISGRTRFCFILGLPWEDRREVEATIRFAAHLHAAHGIRIILQWFGQIPGSRLWDEAHGKQLVNEAMYDDFGFFRNLELFHTGCRLTLRDIFEVSEIAMQLNAVSRIVGDPGTEIEYYLPPPVAAHIIQESAIETFDDPIKPGEDPIAGYGAHSG